MKPPPRLALASCSPWRAACRSSPYGEIERADAEHHLQLAEQEIAEGKLDQALERLAAVHEVSGLDPDTRTREERLIEEAARRRFAELSDAPASELEALFESELPADVRARAGLLAAQRLADEDHRVKAFRMVKKVDQEIPSHPSACWRATSWRASGCRSSRDPGHYGFFLSYRTRGVQTLEYLVVQYPLEPRCPEAYAALSVVLRVDRRPRRRDRTHREPAALPIRRARTPSRRRRPAAVPAAESHPTRRLRPPELTPAAARVWTTGSPSIRRTSSRRGAHELASECRLRLVRSDLELAHYYERTETPSGVAPHATRALASAESRRLEAEASEARALLEASRARPRGSRSCLSPFPGDTESARASRRATLARGRLRMALGPAQRRGARTIGVEAARREGTVLERGLEPPPDRCPVAHGRRLGGPRARRARRGRPRDPPVDPGIPTGAAMRSSDNELLETAVFMRIQAELIDRRAGTAKPVAGPAMRSCGAATRATSRPTRTAHAIAPCVTSRDSWSSISSDRAPVRTTDPRGRRSSRRAIVARTSALFPRLGRLRRLGRSAVSTKIGGPRTCRPPAGQTIRPPWPNTPPPTPR
jgi:hypothetical protein